MNKKIKLSKIWTILRPARLSRKLSLQQLEKLTGLEFNHISRIERGEIIPNLETLEKLFNELHLMIEIKETKKFDEQTTDNEN